MTLPPQPNFIQMLCDATYNINANRCCHLHPQRRSETLLGDLPTQFTLKMTLTKAALQRGVKKIVIASFTDCLWYAVQLDEIVGKTHTLVFQMNPSYVREIKAHLDRYQYELLMSKLSHWDIPQKDIKTSSLLQPRPSYAAQVQVEDSFKKLYYDHIKASKSSFQGVLLFLLNQYTLRQQCHPQLKKAENATLTLLQGICSEILLGTKSYMNTHPTPINFHPVLARHLK